MVGISKVITTLFFNERTVMTRKCVDDKYYGLLWRKLEEFIKQNDEGTLDVHQSTELLQMAIEGRLINHIKNGGLVLSAPMTIKVSKEYIPKNLRRRSDSRHVSQDQLMQLLPSYQTPKKLKLQIAYFDFFGKEQPGTLEVVTHLQSKGYRQANALELICARKMFKPSGEYETILALDTNDSGHDRVLCCTPEHIGEPSFTLSHRVQPWWPYCQRFAVIKEE